MSDSVAEGTATVALLERIRAGDDAALNDLLEQHRPFMRRVVELRLDRRLRSRVDASDVVQEAQIEAARRIRDYLEREPMPFTVWLRQTTFENVLRVHRKHLGAECRAVGREFALPSESSSTIGLELLAASNSPLKNLVREELSERVRAAMETLSDLDREVLLLRSFEGMSNHDTAAVLGIDPATASQRFGRALLRLRDALIEASDPNESR